jgi:hypothetical protein
LTGKSEELGVDSEVTGVGSSGIQFCCRWETVAQKVRGLVDEADRSTHCEKVDSDEETGAFATLGSTLLFLSQWGGKRSGDEVLPRNVFRTMVEAQTRWIIHGR